MTVPVAESASVGRDRVGGWRARVRSAWQDAGQAYDNMARRFARRSSRLTPLNRHGLEFEELSVLTDDGFELASWYVPAPEGGRTDLTVVCHHHFGGQRATLLPWIRLFHRLGLATLSFDGRGHAASDVPAGRHGSFSVRAADVSAACDEALRRGARRIVAFGQSQGAAAVVMGVDRRRDIAGVILECGPAPDMVSASWGLAAGLLGKRRSKDGLQRASLTARLLGGTDVVRYSRGLWSGLLRLREVPLLWIHGDADFVVPRSLVAAWYRPLRPRSGLWRSVEVPRGQHVLSLMAAPDLIEAELTRFVGTI